MGGPPPPFCTDFPLNPAGYFTNHQQRKSITMHSSVYWTPEQAAEFIGHSVATLANYRSEKRGPAWIKLPSGRIRYRPADLVAWMESRQEGDGQ